MKEQAKQIIQQLVQKYRQLTPLEKKELTESTIVHQFLDPFFEALGWPVKDPALFKYELGTPAGRPDMTLFPAQGGNIFVEAKRFGAIQQLEEDRYSVEGLVTPGQLSLPSMATDRTAEEQQAINYAFRNNGQWAILTNFEKLRLFNARRDWLVLSFERPFAYLDSFDLLWQLSYENILAGQLEALSNQRHRVDVDTDYLNFINEWRERLAQDVLRHPAQNPWAFDETGRIKLAELRAVVQRVLDRLVIVRFAEDHLVAPAGTLQSIYDICHLNPYTFTINQFFQKLYSRFHEDHNSNLFATDLTDIAYFSDHLLAQLIEKLYEARYRAMSADIMGNTYEQYLGKTLVAVNGRVETADNLETRKKQGSYYTPQVIVQYLVDATLGRVLYGTFTGRPDGEPMAGESRKTSRDIVNLRVIDPACGSGSFLIYAYEVLANFYRLEITRLTQEREKKLAELTQQGVTDAFELRLELAVYTAEIDRLKKYPHYILERHLYGVDLDPQAAEIATVNLMMRGMADENRENKKLPLILNQNIKVGNGLIGAGAADGRYQAIAPQLAELRRLRLALLNSNHDEGLQQALKQLTETVSTQLNEPLWPHFGELLPAVRPFHWAVEFPELFVNEQGELLGEAAGFDIILGNPPWEILKPDMREYYAQFDPLIESKLPRPQAQLRINQLNEQKPYLLEEWQEQKSRIELSANYFRKSSNYLYQDGGDTATQKLFLEREYQLLKLGGRLGIIIPAGIYSDLGTKLLRQMLFTKGSVQFFYNFSNERLFFPAVHHAFKFTLLGAKKGVQADGFWVTFRFDPRAAVRPDDLPQFLANQNNLIYIHQNSLAKFSPLSFSLLEFQTIRAYKIAETFHQSGLLIGNDEQLGLQFAQEFHMTNDRQYFSQTKRGWALYEGKMIQQFNYAYQPPKYWIREEIGLEKLKASKTENWPNQYRLAFRAIAGSTNIRTLFAAILPKHNFTGNSLWVVRCATPAKMLYFLAIFNSFCLDWIARLFINTNVNLFAVKQLPLPQIEENSPAWQAIVQRAAALTCTTAAFAELWQEVMGHEWSPACGVTEPEARQQLRDELDVLVARLYGLSSDQFAHVLSSFPLVFPETPAGEAKKAALLQLFDHFQP